MFVGNVGFNLQYYTLTGLSGCHCLINAYDARPQNCTIKVLLFVSTVVIIPFNNTAFCIICSCIDFSM